MTLLFLTGCGLTLTHIAVSGSATTTVEAGTLLESLVGDLGFSSLVSMDLTHAEELQNQGVAPEDISRAALTDFSLTAVTGSAELTFFHSMRLSVSADGLDALVVASQDDFPADHATVDFATTEADIREYVVSEAMTLTTDVDAQRPETDTEVRADYVVDVGVTTEGAVSNLD